MAKKVTLFDTTLRDGAQTEGISFSFEDKLKIAKLLDDLGIEPLMTRATISRQREMANKEGLAA